MRRLGQIARLYSFHWQMAGLCLWGSGGGGGVVLGALERLGVQTFFNISATGPAAPVGAD